MDVVIYTRVSTDEQKEKGNSLQDQERDIRRHCEKEGKNVIKHYQEDHSAKNFNRPVFQEFLRDIECKRIKPRQLVCHRMDRFSRNMVASIEMINHLKKHKIDVIFIDTNYDLSVPENLLPAVISMVLPQVENERRALNTKKGMRQKLRTGSWVWRAPRGYINDTTTKTIKVGPESKFILQAFEKVALGLYPIDSIRKSLSTEGFKCSKQGFLNILKNPFYKGQIVIEEWREDARTVVDALHDPIVSAELFEKVQDVLSGRTRKQSKLSAINELFPLRGHLICEKCGRLLTASSSKGRSEKYHYYHCQGGCRERHRTDVVHKSFTFYLDTINVNEEVGALYAEILKDTFNKKEGDKEKRIDEMSEKILKEEARLQTLDKKYLDGEITYEDYQRMKTNLSDLIRSIKSNKDDLNNKETRLDKHLKFGISLLSHLSYYFANAPLFLKQRLVGSIFPEKLVFSNNSYRTVRENSIISLVCSISIDYRDNYNKKATPSNGLSSWAPPVGLEPTTL
jgi:site-specific DNA recombinase